MRRIASLSAAVTLACISTLASGAVPRVAKLPSGAMSQTPALASRPAQVAAGERVEGIHPALPPLAQRQHQPQGSRYVTVYGHPDDAAEHERSGFSQALHDGPTACFSLADHWQLQNGPQEWVRSQGARASLHGVVPASPAAHQYGGQQGGVQALHVERLVLEGEDRATLRFTDAWIDPLTLGVRLIGTGSISLAKVAEGPSGVKVFAARDASDDIVHFVVHSPAPPDRERNLVGRHMMVMRGSQLASSDCGHARLSLRTAPGSGERGTVQLELLLPGDGGESKETKESSVIRPTSIPAQVARAFVGGAQQPPQPREIRVRTLLVHTSLSQSAADPEPIASVSFGWIGRERRMQLF